MSLPLLVSVTLVLVLSIEHFRLFPDLVRHMATVRHHGLGASSRRIDRSLLAMTDVSKRDQAQVMTSRHGGRDPLRHHRAIVGRDARTPWYARVRAVLMLLLIVLGFGGALAGITLVLIASGRILLEILAG